MQAIYPAATRKRSEPDLPASPVGPAQPTGRERSERTRRRRAGLHGGCREIRRCSVFPRRYTSAPMPTLPVTSLTPMMRQYMEVKAQHPDALVMYRRGDFYEMFYEDARAAAPILEVQLTARHKGTESEVPMCGVPHHALEGYLAKLLGAGLRVAICDQVEDPAQAKGLVKREVTRVVTPGTVSDPGLLEGKEENFLAGLVWERGEGAGAFLDVS